MQEKVYCKDCKRLYSTKVDQCEIPCCGLSPNSEEFQKALGESYKKDEKGINFIMNHVDKIFDKYMFTEDKKRIIAHPSKLNKNNDCYFFQSKSKSLFGKFFRNI